MSMQAIILAEPQVDPSYLEAAAESLVRLSDTMGYRGDPQIELGALNPGIVRTNSRGQVDRTIIDPMPPDSMLHLLITARDLGTGDRERSRLNFVFGTSSLGRVIMSTYRLAARDEFAALTFHEIGHAEGLVQPTARNYDRISGFAGHCVNQCLMRPGNSRDDFAFLVRQNQRSNTFCGDCSGFLKGRPRPTNG